MSAVSGCCRSYETWKPQRLAPVARAALTTRSRAAKGLATGRTMRAIPAGIKATREMRDQRTIGSTTNAPYVPSRDETVHWLKSLPRCAIRMTPQGITMSQSNSRGNLFRPCICLRVRCNQPCVGTLGAGTIREGGPAKCELDVSLPSSAMTRNCRSDEKQLMRTRPACSAWRVVTPIQETVMVRRLSDSVPNVAGAPADCGTSRPVEPRGLYQLR